MHDAPIHPSHHQSVLLQEVLAFLQPGPGFRGIDCTTNGGGHSRALLEASAPDGRMLCLDADASALALAARRLAPFAGRVELVHANFRQLARAADERGWNAVDGVVFDLGLSSVQLDLSARGFSFRGGEPLDMRFDQAGDGPTAADLLNGMTEAELERTFREYGEEPRARRLASVVARRRQRAPFVQTDDFVHAVTEALGPKRGRTHPATRPFQALRIAVNDELGAIEQGLEAAVNLLRPGGRVAVITFHSLEDRIVKWRFRHWAEAGELGEPPLLRVLTRKPLSPSEAEQAQNPRARSAKLRVAERVARIETTLHPGVTA